MLTDIHNWAEPKSKLLNYFLKLKTKGKKKPFSRDSRVRRSGSEVFIKITVLSKSAKSLEKYLQRSSFFSKVSRCRPTNLY